MPELPVGIVTFLLTDVQGSTRLWYLEPTAMRPAMARHDALIQDLVAAQGGIIVRDRGEGDSHFAVFSRATDAVSAACGIQQALQVETWPTSEPIRVRIGLHTGEADLRDGGYYGDAPNRCARLRAIGHGGQIIVSGATAQLVQDALGREASLAGISLKDLGEHRLKDLPRPEHVFQILHPALPDSFPPLVSLDAWPNNLPLHLARFVGREQELAILEGLLEEHRLLTLIGPGGSGKTRLAQTLAERTLAHYPDGVWLVELPREKEPALVAQAVATALGVREEAGRTLTATLSDHLRHQQTLLILDNCENLPAACADLATSLLRACPRLTIFATSRRPLRVDGETIWAVPPLGVPSASGPLGMAELQACDAVKLFVERASASNASFRLTADNATAVAAICQRLEGIPLALVLAAARVRTRSVEQIAAQLDDQLHLLRGGSYTAAPHHQTLQAALDWSYDLLAPAEQVLFRRLAVFAGGWSLETAAAVCADSATEPFDPESILDELVDSSLVMRVERAGGGYRLLEMVRQYALQKLREAQEERTVRTRHAAWYLSLAERAAPQLRGADQAEWLERLEAEHENLRAALDWALSDSGDSQVGLALAAAVWVFWRMRGYVSEGRRQLERILATTADAPSTARANVLNGSGILAAQAGDNAQAKDLFDAALAVWRSLGDSRGAAATLNNLAYLAQTRGDHAVARELHEQNLEVRRTLNDQPGEAQTLYNLAELEKDVGRYTQAAELHEASLALRRVLGVPSDIAASLQALGELDRYRGECARAHQRLTESLALFSQVNNRINAATSRCFLADVARDQGDFTRALAGYDQALDEFRALEDRKGEALALWGIGEVSARQGDTRGAEQLMEQSLALFRALSEPRGEALALGGLAGLALREGKVAEARARYVASLALWRNLDDPLSMLTSLEGLARVASARGEQRAAVRLLAVADAARDRLPAPPPLVERDERAQLLEVAGNALGPATFAAAYAEGLELSLAEAVSSELAGAIPEPAIGPV
ncbi:MAG TPA: tetratricopeptide repeat protein [Chloroflexota bacterium]|nr:tetratricopeptide repeat protein [Chloroflexota bacterium]